MPRIRLTLAAILTAALLLLNGLAYARVVAHAGHHAHHNAATHASSVCSWVCAAGQAAEGVGCHLSPALRLMAVDDAPVLEFYSTVAIFHSDTRGPPTPSLV